MFSKKFIKGLAVIASSAMFSLSTIHSAYAAPGTLATAPLFLSTIVEPNVYFTIDDSGSMDWNPMVRDGTAGLTSTSGLPFIDGDDRAYYSPTFTQEYTNRDVVPPAYLTFFGVPATPTHNTEWDDGWVIFNHIGNKNYYNPAVTYKPWPGTDAFGNPMFTDANPRAVLKDPWDPSGESMDLCIFYNFSDNGHNTPNLYVATYYIWIDDDTDGVIEQTDTHFPILIPCGTTEMQNFANWFQYYRSRANATKSIIGSVINNTDASRMGMLTFNDYILEEPGTNNDIHVKSMGNPADKRTLLEAFYEYDIPQQGTPMRNALEDVGQYFDNTNANAPILDAANGGECQQNFNILMGDGFWNGGDPNVGNRDANGGSGNNNTIFDGNETQSNDGGNYADNHSDTLADVAMMDYERDLRGDLANNVPINPGIDEADHQHLVTYSIAFGIDGSLDSTLDPATQGSNFWPDPDDGTNDDLHKVDDMWHAAYNGRGQFFSAQQPDELEASLNAAIADIAERTATAAAVSINSARLTTQSTVYLAQFNTNRWQGNVFAFKIADLNTGELAATPDWTAADELNTRNIFTNPRTILTYDGTNGIPFQWASLNTAQRDDLRTNPGGGVDPDAVAIARLEYLRGDRKDEGTGNFFRERLSLLGDLVNSGPVFVGAPDLNWPDTAPFPTATNQRYSDFKNGPAATREGMIYAGANDGKMHGFSETDGGERLAYISNILFSNNAGEGLHYLTDQNYGHRYYNDLTPTISDVFISGAWKTILVSGLRGGQRGIFALDVTDPSQFAEGNANSLVMWEFTNNHDPDLGFTYSRPQIAMGNNGKWYAIFGNGYNDTGDGSAKLFIVDIVAGLDGGWAPGDYIEIDTNVGTPAERNGLGTPALADLDGNGTVDRAYAGDLFGNMWVFDLSSGISTTWAMPSTQPLFTTPGGPGLTEPLTAQPTLSKHPTQSDTGGNAPNVMVFFGSGQYLTNADKTTTHQNHFYGVWDKGDYSLTTGSLVEQTYDTAFLPARVLTNNAVNYPGGDYGWYVELPDSGERSVTRPVVRGSVVFFNTFVPVSDPCSVGGFGYRFALDIVTGGSPDDVTIDTNGDGIIDDNDKVTDASGNTAIVAAIQQEGFLPEPVFIEDIAYTAETPSKVAKLKDIPKGRFGWQELIQ